MRREMSTRFSGRGGWPGVFGLWIAEVLLMRGVPRGFSSLPLYGMRVAWWKWWGFQDDTEVAGKDACVLGSVSLKREYSQLFVLFWNKCRIRDYTGDVHRRVSIVEGLNGPWYAGFA